MRKAPLTAKARQWLVDNLHNKARLALYQKETEEEIALAHDILATLFGPNWQARFAAVPEGWLPSATSISLKTPETHYSLYIDEQPVPALMTSWRAPELTMPPEMEARLVAHRDARREAQEQLAAFHQELRTSLAAIRTLEALRASWPEAFDMLPDEFKRGSYPLPAGTIEETLRLYGLLVSDLDPLRQSAAAQPVD